METGFSETAAEDRPHRLEAQAQALQRDARPQPGRDGGEGVVDVVKAGQREIELQLALRRRDVYARAGDALQLDLGRGDARGGPVGVAVGAGVVTEVADEGAVVDVGGAAAPAVLGVMRMLELR